jgi:hypothetical protein
MLLEHLGFTKIPILVTFHCCLNLYEVRQVNIEECCLLECDTVLSGRSLLRSWRNVGKLPESEPRRQHSS